MAQKLVTIDDIDGTEDAFPVIFSLDGHDYEIDLSDTNAQKLRDALAGYVAAARKVAPNRPIKAPAGRTKGQQAEVRAWAHENGYDVSSRGRIKAEIVEAWESRKDDRTDGQGSADQGAPSTDAVPEAIPGVTFIPAPVNGDPTDQDVREWFATRENPKPIPQDRPVTTMHRQAYAKAHTAKV